MTETKQKLIALSLATFMLMSVLSGGATFAVLSDSYLVTANLSPAGNVNVAPSPVNVGSSPVNVGSSPVNVGSGPSVESTTTEDSNSEACGIGDTLHNGSASENPGDVSILLEPTNQSIDAGNSTEYEVIVEGASRNITAYTLDFALCNPSVATFENYTHEHVDGMKPEVSQDSIEVSVGVGDQIDGRFRAVLGTITITGNSSGQTRLGIVNVKEDGIQNVRYYEEESGKSQTYNITSTSTVEVKVNESESGT